MFDDHGLLDYDDEDVTEPLKDLLKSDSFRDFQLKTELLQAIADAGYEYPSEVQKQAIPPAILGRDILCQGASGTGKTAVYVLATLQQLQPIDGQVSVLVICPTNELAFQISSAYERFSKHLPNIKVSTFVGGTSTTGNRYILRNKCPHVAIGTPGRLLALAKMRALRLDFIQYFIVDECDRIFKMHDTRRDVRKIFNMTPMNNQVLMLSATINEFIRPICKEFMRKPIELYIHDESKLMPRLLQHFYVNSRGRKKPTKLVKLLDKLEFDEAIIFVDSAACCSYLCQFLVDQCFPTKEIHNDLTRNDRLIVYEDLKAFRTRLVVATNVFERGIDLERVNLIINYDVPEDIDSYLHRAARAGRFGTKGMILTIISSQDEADILNKVQERFKIHIRRVLVESRSDVH
ncbi:unnamed protein product [Adineta ricciae]|uniref:RNA helicase n=1 Tax=Adineta ricciae TaxID=249248 RepID=A0A814IS03_ADIRI|nr:unnamed protein product [Adineta ricciae]CAF1120241.1 unnamed protein product [Adineta ricciae]